MGQNTMGTRLYQQGRYAEALQHFQAAQASDPTNSDAYYNLASTYHKLGVAQKDAKLIEQAESLYHQCLDLQPNHVDCHRGLAVMLAESSRPDAAMRLLKNWSARNPNMPDPKIELARLHQEFGQVKVAEQYLDEALAMNPNDARVWAHKGQLRESSGDMSQALYNYQQSLSINNMQPELYQRVASLNVKLAQQGIAGAGTWTAQTPPPSTGGASPRY
ncbi:MAG: tetratricopeptide repeat protein [Pirellulaceae bacterium]|nr:tetratricopeptide repeat protein [Pirellulaceae bacterium]